MEQPLAIGVDELRAEGEIAAIQIDTQASGIEWPPPTAADDGLIAKDRPQRQVRLRRQRRRAEHDRADLPLPRQRVQVRRLRRLQRRLPFQVRVRPVSRAIGWRAVTHSPSCTRTLSTRPSTSERTSTRWAGRNRNDPPV